MIRRAVLATALAAGLAGAAGAGPAAAGADPAAEVIAIEHQRVAAIAAHDEAYLKALYAADFEGYTAIGARVDQTTMLSLFRRVDGSAVFDISDVKARAFGDTVVVTGVLTGKDAAGKVVAQSRYMHVYVRVGRQWRIEAGQGAPMGPPPSS